MTNNTSKFTPEELETIIYDAVRLQTNKEDLARMYRFFINAYMYDDNLIDLVDKLRRSQGQLHYMTM